MAKEQKSEQNPAPELVVPETLGPPKSYRLHIALGFTSLILLQVTFLWFLLPARQTSPRVGGLDVVEGTRGFENTDPIDTTLIKPENVVEKPINEAKAFTGRATEGDVTKAYSLVMHVTVRKKESGKFDNRYKECQQAIIDRVSSMLNVNVAEHHKEVGYTTLKEKAKKEINGVLGTPWVQSVLISNFSFTEQ